ncbi:THAP domain-containing protein [Phthorimaea operculella]|nr:THAP domain-containing protein [Phthorimaea operculella]
MPGIILYNMTVRSVRIVRHCGRSDSAFSLLRFSRLFTKRDLLGPKSAIAEYETTKTIQLTCHRHSTLGVEVLRGLATAERVLVENAGMSAFRSALMTCCIPDCKYNSRATKLYHFPSRTIISELWIEIISQRYPNLKFSKDVNGRCTKRVCRRHFEERYVSVTGKRVANGIPTLFTEAEIKTRQPASPIEIGSSKHVTVEYMLVLLLLPSKPNHRAITLKKCIKVSNLSSGTSKIVQAFVIFNCLEHVQHDALFSWKCCLQPSLYWVPNVLLSVVYVDKVPLHKFPNPEKDIERFRTWLYKVGGEILRLDNHIIYKRRRLCHHHFEEKFHTRSNGLSCNAVPTLQLSEVTAGTNYGSKTPFLKANIS